MVNNRTDTALLEKVLSDLRDFLPHLVLVGGWVPFLYSRYLWNIRQVPIATIDIDFGFQNRPFKGWQTIADRLMEKNYGQHHVALGKPYPFVPVVQLKGGVIKADVEFITAPGISQIIREKLIGKEIKVNMIEDFDILLKAPMGMTVNSFRVRVPNPARFTFHKLLTFAVRENAEKRLKDLYYAYYVLCFSPEKDKLTSKIAKLLKQLTQGRRVRENIERYFKNPFDLGPSWLKEITKNSSLERLVDDVGQDAFERVKKITGQFV